MESFTAYSIDATLKSGPDWDEIRAWSKTRAKLADSCFALFFLKQPELSSTYGLSTNDLSLMAVQFGGDMALREIRRYKKMTTEASFTSYLYFRFDITKTTFLYLLNYPLILFTLIIFALLFDRTTIKFPCSHRDVDILLYIDRLF